MAIGLIIAVAGIALQRAVDDPNEAVANETGAPGGSDTTIETAAAATGPLSGAQVKELVADLRGGGHILWFRHATRDKWDSVVAFDVVEAHQGIEAERASFREAVCLNAQGVEEAKLLGELFRLAAVPTGPVIASPSCRARQTAELAFGEVDRFDIGLLHTPVLNVDNQGTFKDRIADLLRREPIPAGQNILLVGHGNTLYNHPDLLAGGAQLLETTPEETGFFVLERGPDGVHLEHLFVNMADFASAAITLAGR